MSISFPKKVIFVLPRAAWPSYAGQAKHAVALGSSYKQLGITTVLISIGMNVSRQNSSGIAPLSKAFDEVISIDLHFTSLLQAGMMCLPCLPFDSYQAFGLAILRFYDRYAPYSVPMSTIRILPLILFFICLVSEHFFAGKYLTSLIVFICVI